jgi:hypothetical protein
MLHRSFVRRNAVLAAVLLASAAFSAARAAEPEILQQVPGDAYGVVVVGNVKVLANKVSNAATRLQVTVPPDLIGTLTRSVGITQGFDANGALALVLLKPAADKAGQSYFADVPPLVVLVPTTNASLLLEKFNPTPADKDGISQVALPDNPEEKIFISVVEKKWVALSQKKEDLATYLARGNSFAKTVSPEILKAFEANDLVFWGNIEKLGAGVGKELEDQKAALTGKNDLTVFVDNQDPFTALLEKAGMNAVFDLSQRFFKDAGSAMLTMRLNDNGATLGVVADFKPESPMGKFIAAQPAKPDGVSLKGLPAGNFLFAGAGQWNSGALADVVGEFFKQLVADPSLAKDPRLLEIRQSLDEARKGLGLVNGARMTLLEPPGRGKDGFFNGAMLIDTPDPKALFDLELKMAGSKLAQNTLPDVKSEVTVAPNALTVKEVPLAKMNMKYTLRDETPDKPISAASRQAFQAVQQMYGPNGMTLYMGVVGKRVLIVYGSDLNMIESAVAAAKDDSAALANAPQIAATKDQLVANPLGVAYLPIASWVSRAQTLLAPRAAAPAGPAAAPAPPVVLSAGVSGKTLTAEIHVPIATIIATQDAITRLSGGGGEGGGGVLPGLP